LFGIRHVLDKFDWDVWADKIAAASRSTHHHQYLAILEAEFAHVRIIFQLATFDQDLLSIGFNIGQAEELELEVFAGRRRIDLNIVLLSLMFNEDLTK